MSGVLGLTGGNCYHLHTTVGESGVDESGEETQEATFRSSGNVSLHRTRVLPVAESQAIVGGSSAKIDDESKEQQTHDRKNLDTGKAELGFSIYGDGENVQADDNNDQDGDPCCDVDILGTVPVLNDNRGGGDFST